MGWGSLLGTIGQVVGGTAQKAVSGVVKWVSNAISGGGGSGGGGGGVFTKGNEPKGQSSGGSGGGGSGGSGSGAADEGATDSTGTSSTDKTAENVKKNDPEKNKELAEIRMSEELRETLTLTIRIPKILKGLHTNQFFFLDLTDEFYEKNYAKIMDVIANEKFGRYAGFQKNRFFVEKIVEKGGISGNSMELSLNPIASSHGQYIKMQQEAEKALVDALNDNSKVGSNVGSSGLGGDAVSIGNALAEKYGFCSGVICPDPGGGESYEEMKKTGSGSCYAWSDALYTELNKVGIQARIIQYATSMASNHRSVQINTNGTWEDYPYKQITRASVRKYAGATRSKPNMFVYKEPPSSSSSSTSS